MRRHRAAPRAETPGPARTTTEAKLENVQMKLAAAEATVAKLTAQRDELAMRLWLDQRMPQAEIAERLDRADRRAGGPGLSYAALQRRLWRSRNGNGDLVAS